MSLYDFWIITSKQRKEAVKEMLERWEKIRKK
jgi:hypothetical protein